MISHQYAISKSDQSRVSHTQHRWRIAVGDTARALNPRNPQAQLKEFIEHEGLRMVDFFKLMDKDHSGSISRDEFAIGLTVSAQWLHPAGRVRHRPYRKYTVIIIKWHA